ncbi:thiopeptide-type bacteriocin biosynthesis domain-containing protein [Chitinophaga jiangningensis]|uniref:Thiopeptide-type bacteriocin biosynthesis domain-containing protein n=1 Tax=Chitinophaga jiangningensis TaxID=1419482 RepID=A0A1M6YFF9_9BACT|nr:lantibiotic dehydratase [Chitinophaga jiangningensis]SHL16755.1 thiopeptide-type bacteriocin biosynthesis domain-containing protein [Chitinophaga jiangningensis]
MFESYKAGFFFLRTPLYSLEQLQEFYVRLRGGERYKVFSGILESADFKEALYLASPDFYGQVQKYLDGELTDSRAIAKLEWSLLKYYTRSCYRCTPFGIFAAGSTGVVSEQTAVQFSKLGMQRHVRLDMAYLYDVMTELLKMPEVKQQSVFVPNKTIYASGNRLRYIEVGYTSNGIKSHTIAEIKEDEMISYLLRATRAGCRYRDLVVLVREQGYDELESTAYVDTLIENQLLVMELEPNVTGKGYLEELLEKLREMKVTHPMMAGLVNVHALAAAIKGDRGLAPYLHLRQQVNALLVPRQENQVFQVDAGRPCTINTLDSKVVADVKRALRAVSRLGTSGTATGKVNAFREAFIKKYDRQSVPLLKALDPDIGIDYKKLSALDTVTPQQEQVSRYKMEKLLEAKLHQHQEIVITDAALEKFPLPTASELPDSMYVLFKLTEKDILLSAAAGPSAANLLGRFCHLDAQLEDWVKAALQEEEQLHPDKIFAEIVHLPQPRIGNILTRPHVRAYEIPFLARSSRPQEQQLSLQDLYLKVEDERVILFSRSLGKEVVPRLSSAHNFSSDTTLPVYNFLCDLQFQGLRAVVGWSWERMSQDSFLPRVRYENVILSPATWQITVGAVTTGKLTPALLQGYLEQCGLPAFIEYVEGDNKLILDTYSELTIEFLCRELEHRERIKLVESTVMTGVSPVTNEGLHYNNEYILPLTRQREVLSVPGRHYLLSGSVERVFIPGSEWVYFKLYTSVNYADTLITARLAPLVAKLKKSGLVVKWFFIRYYDPAFHVRVRVQVKRKQEVAAVMQVFYALFNRETRAGKIAQVMLDTYEREVERYGEKTMLLSEMVFDRDSSEVVRLLDAGANRQLAGLTGLAAYFAGLDLTLEQRAYLAERHFQGFSRELGKENDAAMKLELDRNYRLLQKEIAACMGLPVDAVQQALLEKIRRAAERTGMAPSVLSLAGSYVHMFINRLFAVEQRRAECELYYYAAKYYASMLARSRKKV